MMKPAKNPQYVVGFSIDIKVNREDDDDDDDEDDDEPSDPLPIEVPGGEKEITDEVTTFTKEAHQKRVDMVKTKETLTFELKTIRISVKKYKVQITKVKTEVTTITTDIKELQTKLELLKTTSTVGKTEDKKKAEGEISVVTTTITEKQTRMVSLESMLIEWKNKLVTIIERRKQIKYIIEVKVLEAKEAEQAVLEAIKTVTDVELVNRKRWIASKTVSKYKKCRKFMGEYKMIYDKQ